ncbi:MAG: hypothetical protein ACFFCQ_00275 [Promethearchaeota archaeon]
MLNSFPLDSPTIQFHFLLTGSTATRHGWGDFIPAFGATDQGIPPYQGEIRPFTLTPGRRHLVDLSTADRE